MARGKIGDYSRAKLLSIIDSRTVAGAGDITAVTAGDGLTGGGTSGDVTLDVDIGGSDGQLLYNDGTTALGGVSSLSFNDSTGDLQIIDDTKLIFGTNSDAHIEYNENGDDFLIISGSSKGMVLSGTTVQIRGTLVGASPLQIAGGVEMVSLEGEPTTAMSFGDDIKLYFGSDDDTYIQYTTGRASEGMELSGTQAGGMRLLGGSIYIDPFLGVGVEGTSITHAITLPESDTNAGKIKATAYTTYSSERFKENIQPIQNPLEIIHNLEGVTFDWKNTQSPDIGFVAEQVGKHLPNIVDWEENGVDAQSMDYSKIVPILVEAIKNQQSQIDKLKEQIISLIDMLKAD